MMNPTFRNVMIICTMSLLTGCAAMQQVQVVKVDVPYPIPCNIIPPVKPALPFTDNALSEDIYRNSQNMLAEIELRKGYETQLEAGIGACNSRTLK